MEKGTTLDVTVEVTWAASSWHLSFLPVDDWAFPGARLPTSCGQVGIGVCEVPGAVGEHIVAAE